ncbi:MAG: SHOCT domain-containing protein [Bacteroidetes bacterium]|nr:SHOCT domain-containing protein [Bacteroidota bacterium]
MWNSGCSWWWGPGYFFGGPFGMIVGLIFWALVIYAIFRLISNLTNRSAVTSRKENTPLEILKRRYAAGDIDEDEFDRKKRNLNA